MVSARTGRAAAEVNADPGTRIHRGLAVGRAFEDVHKELSLRHGGELASDGTEPLGEDELQEPDGKEHDARLDRLPLASFGFSCRELLVNVCWSTAWGVKF